MMMGIHDDDGYAPSRSQNYAWIWICTQTYFSLTHIDTGLCLESDILESLASCLTYKLNNP